MANGMFVTVNELKPSGGGDNNIEKSLHGHQMGEIVDVERVRQGWIEVVCDELDEMNEHVGWAVQTEPEACPMSRGDISMRVTRFRGGDLQVEGVGWTTILAKDSRGSLSDGQYERSK